MPSCLCLQGKNPSLHTKDIVTKKAQLSEIARTERDAIRRSALCTGTWPYPLGFLVCVCSYAVVSDRCPWEKAFPLKLFSHKKNGHSTSSCRRGNGWLYHCLTKRAILTFLN